VFVLALLFLIGTVGCAPKAAAGPVTIHVMTMDQAGLKARRDRSDCEGFEAQNPDIKVSMEYVGYDNVHDKDRDRKAAKPPLTMPP